MPLPSQTALKFTPLHNHAMKELPYKTLWILICPPCVSVSLCLRQFLTPPKPPTGNVVSEKTQVDKPTKPRMWIPIVFHQTLLEKPIPGRDFYNKYDHRGPITCYYETNSIL